ncbi:MAG: M28 family peptidase [Chitinophagaceae bacterium]|nr:M28 family peptidase [Chitinophagaceae bacterium]
MMKYVFAYILLAFCCKGFAQDTDPQPYAQSINSSGLKKHLLVLTSDSLEGRETATEGQRKAANYIEGVFKNAGLLPGWNGQYQQSFPVYQSTLNSATLNVNGVPLKMDTDYVVTPNSSFNVSFAASEVLFVGYGLSDSTRDDYKDVNARGKIVMVFPGAGYKIIKGKKVKDRIPDYLTLQQAAQKNGAIALLITDKRFPRKPTPGKSNMYVLDQSKEPLPNTFIISDSVGRKIMGNDYYIAQRIMKNNPPPPKSCYLSVTLSLDRSVERMESSNVIAKIEGTDKKDEAVIITSHYDHLGKTDSVIYHGADDDGSGTATVLEMAQAFSKATAAGLKPRRTLIFMTVSGEEKGLWGSSYYAENPSFPLEKISANINIDMIGRIEDGRKEDSLNYIYVVGDDKLSSDLRPVSEAVNNKYSHSHLDYKFNDPNDPMRIYYRSDHYNFAKNGVPAIFYFSGLHADYHRPTDTEDKIRYDLLTKRAQLIFYTAWQIANRDEMLKRDIPLPALH